MFNLLAFIVFLHVKCLKTCGSKLDKHLLQAGLIHPACNSACGRISVVNVAVKRVDENSISFPGCKARLPAGLNQGVSSPVLPAQGAVHLHQTSPVLFEMFQADFPDRFSHPSRFNCGVCPGGVRQLMKKASCLWTGLHGSSAQWCTKCRCVHTSHQNGTLRCNMLSTTLGGANGGVSSFTVLLGRKLIPKYFLCSPFL